MIADHQALKRLVRDIFAAAGCDAHESDRISHYLVEANLVGHDSHGVIRVPTYIGFLRSGHVVPNRHLSILQETECVAVCDGRFGFGQVIGEEAVEVGIRKSGRHGVAVVALRNCGHLGRIGDWPLLAARRGRVSLHFVNTSGLGNLVAPVGGIERRLSANPIAIGVPVPGRQPILLDISTSAIAEGKLKVAFNKGVPVPDGCIIDAEGRPTNDPKVFYGDPPGAILPFGGHKGYGLGIMTEFLAGALTGNGCTAPGVKRLSNGMLSIYLDPAAFGAEEGFVADIVRYVDFVKSSKKSGGGAEILVPGDPEVRTKARRLREGIDLDETTWRQIGETAASLGVPVPDDVVLAR
jgi:uncharacterized oxidoreductase